MTESNQPDAGPLGLASTAKLSYPLAVCNYGGEDGTTLMSKGHHDKAAFLKACEDYWEEPLESFDEPAHMWWRWVPTRPGDDYRGRYHEAKPGARGAFPCTAITQW